MLENKSNALQALRNDVNILIRIPDKENGVAF